MSFTFTLPAFNGAIQVGLSAASDLDLPDAEKLQFHKADNASNSGIATAAACLAKLPPGTSGHVRKFIANAAFAIVNYGLTGDLTIQGSAKNASDWMKADATTITQDLIDEASKAISEQQVIVAVTVICCTKLMWWTSNHHVGQGTFYPYMKKVAGAMLPDMAEADRLTYCHRVGHWASTHKILNILHIRTTVSFIPLMPTTKEATVTLTDDLKLRVTSMPAGTAKHVVSHAILKKYGQHKIFMFSSRLNECFHLSEEVQKIMDAAKASVDKSINANNPLWNAIKDPDPRLVYHMGATYLTGGESSRQEFRTAEMTGHLGPVMYHLYRNATLTRSPNLVVKVGARDNLIYQGSDSFSQDWEDKCIALAAAMVTATSATINRVCGASSEQRADEDTWCNLQMAIGAYKTMREAREAYHKVDDLFNQDSDSEGEETAA